MLSQTRYPSSLKDLEAAYCNSAAFKDIYQYLKYNKLPNNRRLAKRVESIAEDYYVLGTLLFKYINQKSGDLEAVLCIPPSKIDFILDMYHGTLIGGHQGMNKTLRTLSSRYYCPRLADYIRAYIVGCHTCQLFKNSKRFHRPFHKRVYDISQPALANVSMDIKYMPKSTKGYSYMLIILCEITNFLVTIPLKQATAPEVCKALVEEFIAYFSTPVRIVCDQDPAFMSSLCKYCFQQYKIQILTVSVTNHKSLQAEHGIKSLSNLIITHLSGLGVDWPTYARPCMLTYNSYATPNLDGFCPFELVFGRKPRIVPILEISPPVPVTGTYQNAFDLLNKKLRYFREMLIKFRDRRFEVMNRDREFHGYTSGQLVYLFYPSNSTLTSNRRKFTCQFVGPLAIWKCFSPTQFVLIKDFNKEPMTLHQIETVKVPIVDTNQKADSYTEVVTTKPYIATNKEYYIQLVLPELVMCKKIRGTFYCEELFLVKHKTQLSCESAIYYNLSREVILENCQFNYYYNITVTPSVLDGGSHIVLANMMNKKKLICSYDQSLARPLPSSSYALVSRDILCNCHIQIGLTYVLKSITSCNETKMPTLEYTVNLAFMNYFHSFWNNGSLATLPLHPTTEEIILPISMEDFTQDPDFIIYGQHMNRDPDTLQELSQLKYQKQIFMTNKKELFNKTKAENENGIAQVPFPRKSKVLSFSQ